MLGGLVAETVAHPAGAQVPNDDFRGATEIARARTPGRAEASGLLEGLLDGTACTRALLSPNGGSLCVDNSSGSSRWFFGAAAVRAEETRQLDPHSEPPVQVRLPARAPRVRLRPRTPVRLADAQAGPTIRRSCVPANGCSGEANSSATGMDRMCSERHARVPRVRFRRKSDVRRQRDVRSVCFDDRSAMHGMRSGGHAYVPSERLVGSVRRRRPRVLVHSLRLQRSSDMSW